MPLAYLDSTFRKDRRSTIIEKTPSSSRLSLIELSSKLQQRSWQSLSQLSSIHSKESNTNRITKHQEKFVQLYKPIYVATCSKNIRQKFFYEQGDEFELVKKIDEDYLQVLHLRSQTECILHRTRLRVDDETPLRLAYDDRGVIQRCLYQHNVPGAYLIRRSQNEPKSFVLSISQVLKTNHVQDFHHLIQLDMQQEFYFAKEIQLKHLRFKSFHQLIRHDEVRKIIRLTTIVPHRIDFEEDLWHIPRRQISFEYRLGKGEFGEVWRGSWLNGERVIPVAIKKLNPLRHDPSSLQSFIDEIEILKALRNNYIVALYGIAEDLQTNETFIVTELMECGDLKQWLKSLTKLPNENTIISYAYDICRGMLFLEQKYHVHRDLACRNLLLAAEGKTLKIADFGLSHLVTKGDFLSRKEPYLKKIPIRWSAPEVLTYQSVYSIKADVWSFGIVLIEIWLKGADPYPDEKDFDSVRSLVQMGYVHKKPSGCSNQFYNRLILPCLCFQADRRPTFKSLVELLRQWNQEKADYERFQSPYIEFSSA